MRNSTSKEFTVDGAANQWIVANVGQMGYYRVNYDASNWDRIIAQLNSDHTQFDVKNRAQIIDDAFSLARAGQLGYDVAFGTTSYLANEKEFVPWRAVYRNVGYINSMLSLTPAYGLYLTYIKGIASPRFEDLGFESQPGTPDDPTRIYLRSYVIGMMCGADDEKCLDAALKMFRRWSKNGTPISPDIRSEVYCHGVKAGNIEDWEFVFEQFKKSDDASEKRKLLAALSCTREPWLLSRILDMSLEGVDIRKQDAASAITLVASNKIGLPITWDFFRGNWNRIVKDYGVGSFTLPNIVKRITSSFSTDYRLQQLQDFIKQHPDQASAKRAFKQAVEKTQTNIDWLSKNYDNVADWLKKESQKS